MIRVMIEGPGVPDGCYETWQPAIPQPGHRIFIGNDDFAVHLEVERVVWYIDTGEDFNQPPTIQCQLVPLVAQPAGFCEGVPFWEHPDGSERAAPPAYDPRPPYDPPNFADMPDRPDGSCAGCGAQVDEEHGRTCPVYLARIRRSREEENRL